MDQGVKHERAAPRAGVAGASPASSPPLTKSTKDATASRKNLVAEIIQTAKMREEELDSSWWTDAKVKKCLQKQNLET